MNLTNAIRKALKDSGAPLTLDQLMEQLPDDAERNVVASRCRGLKQAGEISTSVEDGKIAYAWSGGGHAATRTHTLTERIRELLRGATAPMTAAEVCAALPDDKPESVQSLLAQRARAGEFATVSAGGRKLAYTLAGNGHVSVAVNVGNVTTAAAPAPALTPTPTAPPSSSPRAAQPTAPASPPVDLAAALNESVRMAEAARDTYVESLVDMGIYTWLQESVRAARAARDAHAGGAK